jgi:hypothetical protein
MVGFPDSARAFSRPREIPSDVLASDGGAFARSRAPRRSTCAFERACDARACVGLTPAGRAAGGCLQDPSHDFFRSTKTKFSRASRRLARSEDSFAPDAAPAVKDPRAPRTFQSASRFQRFIAHTFN